VERKERAVDAVQADRRRRCRTGSRERRTALTTCRGVVRLLPFRALSTTLGQYDRRCCSSNVDSLGPRRQAQKGHATCEVLHVATQATWGLGRAEGLRWPGAWHCWNLPRVAKTPREDVLAKRLSSNR